MSVRALLGCFSSNNSGSKSRLKTQLPSKRALTTDHLMCLQIQKTFGPPIVIMVTIDTLTFSGAQRMTV